MLRSASYAEHEGSDFVFMDTPGLEGLGVNISPFAVPADRLGFRMFTERTTRKVPLYGVMLHTTGGGVGTKAAGDRAEALKIATQIYTDSGGPHYVVGWDGTIVATVADENIRGAHAGIDSATQRKYLENDWQADVSAEGARLWAQRWPGRNSPVDLVPDGQLDHINDHWIGIEMIPVTPGGSTFWARPAFKGSRFSTAQYAAVKRLIHDIAQRNQFPVNWASPTLTRLVGHSDINPIARDTSRLPLWDPGDHIGLFDMDSVRAVPLGIAGLVLLGLGAGYMAWKFKNG